LSIKYLEHINYNYSKAIQFHKDLFSVFELLYMRGFSQFHIYQCTMETKIQEKLKKFAINMYHKILAEEYIKPFENIDPKFLSINRMDIKSSETCNSIKYLWKLYRDYEAKNLELYESYAKQLNDKNDVVAYDFIKNIAVNVSVELQHINNTIVAYNAMDWDLAQIVAEQDTIHERYLYLIREMYKNYNIGHHFNSLVDAESRVSVLDKYPDN